MTRSSTVDAYAEALVLAGFTLAEAHRMADMMATITVATAMRLCELAGLRPTLALACALAPDEELDELEAAVSDAGRQRAAVAALAHESAQSGDIETMRAALMAIAGRPPETLHQLRNAAAN